MHKTLGFWTHRVFSPRPVRTTNQNLTTPNWSHYHLLMWHARLATHHTGHTNNPPPAVTGVNMTW